MAEFLFMCIFLLHLLVTLLVLKFVVSPVNDCATFSSYSPECSFNRYNHHYFSFFSHNTNASENHNTKSYIEKFFFNFLFDIYQKSVQGR